ncbi:AAA family ATPase [Anabaena catenula]|uniref:histidine kinase n=1 Tax=Anabaena catenula FACHB-362 TaxID=2692877 RepID=A0ABR8JAY9_9NOST|nr:AAA family ATPase [Anabaena catenula]MBD2694685.1 AAA family ATPase [Anabaena catenula FACHB-362]
MFEISGYNNLNKIYESDNSLVFRAVCQQDQTPVIIKILKQDYPSKEAIARSKLEYKLVSSLKLKGTVKTRSLEKYQNTLAIIFEDDNCESLKSLISQRKLTLQEFLKIGIQITQTLAEIHAENIIHHDINPANIIIHPQTQQVKIIDFGIATILTRETPTICHPNILEGTLAYISPEQTGRMNRVIDYRTDFYSLGVTFYEMLTQQLPFVATDAIELVHCHLAKQAIAPHLINPEIPPIISQIIIKLLAKTAEERYQNAIGIQADLKECLRQLQQNDKILEFPLAQQDISDKFQISQKLYGREAEITTLKAAVERVSQGTSELILISGYSGIGKTSLVQEIYQPLTQKRGYFIAGKYDQLQRNIPYSALIQALRELIRQLLTESEAEIAAWKEKILAAVQSNGKVIVNVIPEVELIIGIQPDVPELPPKEVQNRFNIVLQNFISVFAQKQHPLVIFIDDLQWADIASLKIIESLMTQWQKKYFLLIGAYRENEVTQGHSLLLTIDNIQQVGATINDLYLMPLDIASISQLICNSLKCTQEQSLPLAKLALEKTAGNPFFLIEFLRFIYNKKLLNFDINKRDWKWNIEEIKSAPIAENVVDLMTEKITALSESTQQVLKLAACIGSQFDVQTLSIINKTSIDKTKELLWETITQGLIQPIAKDYTFIQLGFFSDEIKVLYKFVHDRVQQAAYSLIPEKYKPIIHPRIGNLLLNNTSTLDQENEIFSIVYHLNYGIKLIDNQQQRDELAKLNLIAGKQAKKSTAYETAWKYLTQGLELLAANRWEKQYDLTLSLYVEAAETAYLCGQFDTMDKLISVVLQRAVTLLDKVTAYEIQIFALTAQRQLLKVIQIGLVVLKELKVNISIKPTLLDIFLGVIQVKFTLLSKQIFDLKNLTKMTSPEKIAVMKILSSIGSAIYMAVPKLLPIIVLKATNLSIKYGNTTSSPISYASYGLILCGALGDIESGYKFGNLALSLLTQLNAKETAAKTIYIVSAFIQHWQEHGKQTLEPLLEGYTLGLETGDLENATYCAAQYCYNSFFVGKELSFVNSEIIKYSHAIQKFKQERNLQMLIFLNHIVSYIMHKPGNIDDLLAEDKGISQKLLLDIQAHDRTSICSFYYQKAFVNYLFDDFSQAVTNLETSEVYMDSLVGLLGAAIYNFYNSLIKLSVYPSVSKSKKKDLLKQIKINQNKMKKWARFSPMNHLHKFYLVEAEKYRVLGKNNQASDLYDRAISLAKENEYIHEAAIAYELAAKFYLSTGKELTARAYMQEARYHYQLWGAAAKVQHLETQYPQLLTINSSKSKDAKTSISISNTGSTSNLDITTVMKASQAISGEIMLDNLLSSLMKILIENAGAQKGYLILADQEKLVIEAEGSINSEGTTLLQPIPVDNCQILSEAIVNYVARTKEIVVLNDATNEGNFTSDNYIQAAQPKSILCVPLINQGKLISIVFQLPENLPKYVITDEVKLRQVLINLLGNAVKFTDNGLVKLRVELGNQTESSQVIIFEIEDTGCGISSTDIESLFQPFVQTSSGKQAQEGTGLGLAISRQFVRLMGGDINCRSTLGKGSIFRFDISVQITQPPTEIVNKKQVVKLAANQPNFRILIVDDRPETRELLTQLLESVGFETGIATNGQEAITMWQQWQPHLIWMDMRMPLMDGYTATKKIQAMQQTKSDQKTVIIALTASAFEEQRTEILAAGCNDFVRKPFSADVIFEKIAQYLGVQYVYATESETKDVKLLLNQQDVGVENQNFDLTCYLKDKVSVFKA